MHSESEDSNLKYASFRSSNAFICVVSLVFARTILNLFYLAISRRIGHPSVATLVSFYEICLILFLMLTIFYSRVRSLNQFNVQFGFCRPGLITFLASVLGGIVLALVAFALIRWGLSGGRNPMVSYILKYGQNHFSYIILIFMGAPFFEEVIGRGFLYKAFRQDFSVPISVVFVILIMVLGHFIPIFSGIASAFGIIGVNIITSMIREKTNSIWNCIGFHGGYNFIWMLSCIR